MVLLNTNVKYLSRKQFLAFYNLRLQKCEGTNLSFNIAKLNLYIQGFFLMFLHNVLYDYFYTFAEKRSRKIPSNHRAALKSCFYCSRHYLYYTKHLSIFKNFFIIANCQLRNMQRNELSKCSFIRCMFFPKVFRLRVSKRRGRALEPRQKYFWVSAASFFI